MLLRKLLKEQSQDVALLMTLLELYMLLFCDRTRFFERMNLIKVNACIFLDLKK